MQLSNRRLEKNVWTFAFLCCLYFLASFTLFILTSGGWSVMLYMMGGTLFFVPMAVGTLGAAVRYRRKGGTFVSIPLSQGIALLLLQCFLLLFNFGDCGDAGGVYQFIQRIGRDPTECIKEPLFKSLPLIQLYFFLVLVYAVALIRIVCVAFGGDNKNPPSGGF